MALEYTPRAFSVEEFHRLAEAGILRPDEHVELLDGMIVERPSGDHHWRAHDRIVRYLTTALGSRAVVTGQSPFPLGERDEPKPDITILDPKKDRTTGVFAVVELANAVPKLRLYARFGLPDYLVVDLEGNVLLHNAEPHEGTYRHSARLSYGDQFTLTRLSDLPLKVDAFLEPRGAPTE
jgi:Uma2 family endonuclease